MRASSTNACDIEITEVPVNVGDGKGMEVPYKLTLNEEKICIDTMERTGQIIL